jgi:hypothetical protein
MTLIRNTLFAVTGALALLACAGDTVSESDARNFHLAIEASNAGTRLTNRYVTEGTTPSPEQRNLVLRHTRIALEHTRLVRDRALASMHDDMPVMFRNRFERGLELVAEGIENRRPGLMAEGHRHIEAWADWVESNAAEIRFPPKPADQDG